MHIVSKLIFLSNLSLSSLAFAATPGTLGTSSTGTLGISLTVPSLVQITGLTDITLTASSVPTGTLTGNTTACIYSNVTSPAGSYFVTATSTNATGGAFRVKYTNTTTSTDYYIPYTAYWNVSSAPTPTLALTSGTKTTQAQTNGNISSLTCGGTPNANFNILLDAAQIASAPAATYTDTVTLLITPS